MVKKRIKALLIEDSLFMRKLISEIIKTDPDIDLIGYAADGKEGSAMALSLKPDVVITDMVMPEYDGMYVVRSLMQHHPVPIILLSALEKTNARIFDALQHGAFEFIDKPAALDHHTIKNYHLLPLIKAAAQTDVTILKARQRTKNPPGSAMANKKTKADILLIGASTGGPAAVETLITHLPGNLNIPIVIAQHMPSRFVEIFSERLNKRSDLLVKVAQSNEDLKPGVVYIVPSATNTIIKRKAADKVVFAFTAKRYPINNDPSIDGIFTSAAKVFGERTMGIILSGMGADGSKGLGAIRKQGGITIAQDEFSSTVYSMPKAAIDAGHAGHVVSLSNMSRFVLENLYC
jgi:two-component system, chemotaxis family, protein-glutamate methylesterase/glutaminase